MRNLLGKQTYKISVRRKNVIKQLNSLVQIKYPIFNKVEYYGLEKNRYNLDQYIKKARNKHQIITSK